MSVAVIVLGAGGHARVVIDALQRAGVEIAGLCAPELPKGMVGPLGVTSLGNDGALSALDPAAYLLANGIGSTGRSDIRDRLFDEYSRDGWRFATVIHPSAIIGGDCSVHEGAQIMAGAVVQSGCVIGRNTIVNTASSLDHDCRIGDYSHVAPGAVLCGAVCVGERSHIGTGAVVIQGVSIGSEVLIGAGATICRDVITGDRVPAGAVVRRKQAPHPGRDGQ
ncbi:MAG: acetyltransferase [Rhodospirillaceae bacterium]|nr:acetyltransferase [Rhodospirillales bacterium]